MVKLTESDHPQTVSLKRMESLPRRRPNMQIEHGIWDVILKRELGRAPVLRGLA